MASLYYTPDNEIKTQKAKGIKALIRSGTFTMPTYTAFILLPQGRGIVLDKTEKWFARPCPVTPRHGFVESRPVKTMEEALEVLREAREVDPEAEVILMPLLTGKYSGVATNVGVTWGMGNDGVTSGGKGKTFLIPTPMTSRDTWTGTFRPRTIIDAGILNTAYLELVEDKEIVNVVQLRDGPVQPTTPNFIPKKITVKKVLKAKGDLLAWEQIIKNERNTKGLVIDHYQGALSSHYAVHAIAAGIPVVTDKQIEVGMVLSPSKKTIPLSQRDYRRIAALTRKWIKFDHYNLDHSKSVHTAVATIHAQGSWGNAPHLIKLRAFSVVALMKFMASAAVGELRHWSDRGPGFYDYTMRPITKLPVEPERSGIPRRVVYHKYLKLKDIKAFSTDLKTAEKDFLHEKWPSRKHNVYRKGKRAKRRLYWGYGGPKWAEVSRVGYILTDTLQDFIKNPNVTTWNDVVMAANNAIHTAHNGGVALNKWADDAMLKKIANAPVWGFMNNVSAEVVLGLLKPGAK